MLKGNVFLVIILSASVIWPLGEIKLFESRHCWHREGGRGKSKSRKQGVESEGSESLEESGGGEDQSQARDTYIYRQNTYSALGGFIYSLNGLLYHMLERLMVSPYMSTILTRRFSKIHLWLHSAKFLTNSKCLEKKKSFTIPQLLFIKSLQSYSMAMFTQVARFPNLLLETIRFWEDSCFGKIYVLEPSGFGEIRVWEYLCFRGHHVLGTIYVCESDLWGKEVTARCLCSLPQISQRQQQWGKIRWMRGFWCRFLFCLQCMFKFNNFQKHNHLCAIIVAQNFDNVVNCKWFCDLTLGTTGVTQCFSPKKIPAILHHVIGAVSIF